MKRQLQLFGDRTKAAKFIKFADRKMGEMKNQMRLQRLKMLNKLFRFGTDNIEVYIESYHGFDKIRIRAAKAEEVCFDFAGSPTPVSVDTTVSFTQDNSAGFLITNKFHLWDFGDGAFRQRERINPYTEIHGYPLVGTYTVKRSVSPSVIWENINSTAMTNMRKSAKASSFHSTEAAAWAEYISLSFTTSSTSDPRASHSLSIVAGPAYAYGSGKLLFDLDLTTYDNTKSIYLAVSPAFGATISVRASGVQSSLGGSINAAGMTTLTKQYYKLVDVTQYAGQIVNDVTIEDNSGFPRFSSAIANTGWTLWDGSNTDPGVLIFREHDVVCTETKSNLITVE